MRLELATYALRMRCSTAELKWHWGWSVGLEPTTLRRLLYFYDVFPCNLLITICLGVIIEVNYVIFTISILIELGSFLWLAIGSIKARLRLVLGSL